MKKLRIHPATWIFLLFIALTGFGLVLIPYLISITLHELAHAYVAKKCGYSLNKVWILPYGACVSFEEFSFNPSDEIKIAVAGPLMNGFLIIVTVMIWWIFPEIYTHTYSFVLSNFSIMIFNLLPAFPLDGGRILTSLLRTKFKSKTVYKATTFINLLFSILFLVLFIVSAFFKINLTFALMAIFLFIGIFDGKFQGKYSPLFFEAKKKKKEVLAVKTICINSSTPLYKILPEIRSEKFNVVYVRFKNNSIKLLTEIQLQKLFESHSLDDCLEDIYKK